MSVDEERVRTLMSSLKRRGIVYPAFELYGGVAGLFDYGPVGARILRLVNNTWLHHWLSKGNICLLYTSPSPRDKRQSRMPSSA